MDYKKYSDTLGYTLGLRRPEARISVEAIVLVRNYGEWNRPVAVKERAEGMRESKRTLTFSSFNWQINYDHLYAMESSEDGTFFNGVEIKILKAGVSNAAVG